MKTPVHILLRGMSQKELCHWMAYYKIKAEEHEEKHGEATGKKSEKTNKEITKEEQQKRDVGLMSILLAASANN